MKEIIFALLASGIGLGLLFFGYRLAKVFITIWAFFAGFSLAAAGVADATNQAFLGTTLGFVIGLAVGLVFALLAYFFYSLAVVLLGANLGYIIGTSFMGLFGLEKGFVTVTIGIVIGVIFALLTISLNAAKYLLIVLTSMAGSTILVGGALLLLNQIELGSFDYSTAKITIDNSWFWNLTSFGLLIIGVISQTVANKNYTITDWTTSYGAPKNSNTYKNPETKD